MAYISSPHANLIPPVDGQKPLGITAFFEGGGSRIAFHIGWAEEILRSGRIGFDAICGTSAGGIVGAVLTHGLAYEKTHGHRDHHYTMGLLDNLQDSLTVCSSQNFMFNPLNPFAALHNFQNAARCGSMMLAGWNHVLGNKHVLVSLLEQIIDNPNYINDKAHAPTFAVAAIKCSPTQCTELVLHHNRGDKPLTIPHIATTGAHTKLLKPLHVDGAAHIDGGESAQGRNPPIKSFITQFGIASAEAVLVRLDSKEGEAARIEELGWLRETKGIPVHEIVPRFSPRQLAKGLDCIDPDHMDSMRILGRAQADEFLRERFGVAVHAPHVTHLVRPTPTHHPVRGHGYGGLAHA